MDDLLPRQRLEPWRLSDGGDGGYNAFRADSWRASAGARRCFSYSGYLP